MSYGNRRLLLVCVLLFALLAGARAYCDRPMVDEAWLGSPALNLLRQGTMYTSILEARGTYYEGLNRYTYWILPVYPVLLAGWFAVVGFGLFAMRALSIVFGCGLVLATYGIVTRLRDKATGLLAALFVAVDFVSLRGGAVGRMDVICAACGFGGIAAYLTLRERSVRSALLGGHVLVAISVFTHPNGVLYFIGLMLTAAVFDRPRIRFSHLALAALPYLTLAGIWAVYLSHDPELFRRQFGGNAAGRMAGIVAPLAALKRELALRYLGGGTGGRGESLFRIGLALPYILGVAGALTIRDLRNDRGVRLLLAFVAVNFTYEWLFDSVKIYLYLVHLSPLYMALFAIVVRWLWVREPRLRLPATAVCCVVIAIQVAGTAYTIVRNSYRNTYMAAVDAVRQQAQPGDLVMGSAELAYGLGFDSNFIDDIKLGLNSGRRPDVVVLDARYRQRIADMAAGEEKAYAYVTALLSGYKSVFARADYEVLVRPRARGAMP